MHTTRKRLALGVVVAAGALAATATAAGAADTHSDRTAGAVYVLGNSPDGNAVLAFDRAADGTLAFRAAYPTDGRGTGGGLGSQGSIAFGADHHELYAVNAASDTISAFRVRSRRLELQATVPSGGTTPISITVHDHTLYVLNAGGTPNITGFDTSGHRLAPIPGSTRPLGAGSAGPAQVAFSPDGASLVVTEKASSTIDTYAVGDDGVAGDPVVNASTGGTPFGFDFDHRGNVLVSNASGSASSYRFGPDGELSVVSGAVPTGQAAPCWLVTSHDGRFAYTANAGAGSISGFRVGSDGSLTLLDPDGVTASLGTGSHPLDEAVSTDGRYLYNLTDGQHAITALHVNEDGSLTTVGVIGGLPVGAAGIVAS